MIDVTKNGCCGCEVCVDACPFNAISMAADGLGFRNATVDTDRCNNCGLCDKVCPLEIKRFLGTAAHDVHEARHRNLSEVKTSRSGAAFVALSDVILDNGGIVYGACIDSEMHVSHTRATTRQERDTFKGSKYIQSKSAGIYRLLKFDLQEGKTVMFAGTPCQCAGLANYLPMRLYANLILIDMVCHGVASDAVWSDFLKMIEAKEKKKIKSVDFRDKVIYGWSGLHRESFIMSDDKKVVMPVTFYQSFLLRSACHSCPFSTEERVSDITLGDFWNWRQSGKIDNSDDCGISIVMCNTEKGKALLDAASDDLIINKIDFKSAIQPNLQHPTPEDPLSKQFEEDYIANGFDYVRRKYYKVSAFSMLKYRIKRLMGRY
ncbi:Coenzyme F420 hydrogenase/dehydrogenase, beta subunit C-terminal domain [uncultured Duncaniella sp.]|uniref:Coenzyme F420 hydrogenase/dehydrogenase, beta subunit C-terminal domain n=1 Tax=uncultured Duncaniella sp. TaxID=2768039 RepID=UPI002674540B|nr:Coenzyme F420 hydrogenase/dehydrogenase, beta subunit C-terminal domain [uncultured Duncaniella sp.]